MKTNINNKILDCISKVHDKSEKCKLEISFFDDIDNELITLSDYFGVTKSQSLIIAVVFSLSYKLPLVEFNDIAKHFECNPMRLLEFNNDFEHLQKLGVLVKDRMMDIHHFEPKRDSFKVEEEISDAIIKNCPMPKLGITGFKDVIEFLEGISKLQDQRDDEIISSRELFSKAKELIESNLHFPLIKRIYDFECPTEDTFLYLYLIWKRLSGQDSFDISSILEVLHDQAAVRIAEIQEFYSGTSALLKNNLLAINTGGFLNDIEVQLTDESAEILEDYGLKIFTSRRKKDNIINPDNIAFKKLLFDEVKMKQLSTLKQLLIEENLVNIRERLSSKNLPMGINIILHGLPGTGKTETALQLAKETKRDILKVEISQSKSMWFGESERLIKKIFTDYRAFSKESERVPILLFNEADAILTRRFKSGNSSTSQTENAIQNILLEELENFDGILIATTNLAGNLDTAFERRFLFKIEFDKPDIQVKASIWKSKIPALTENECTRLSTKFDFSGGQIENVARKSEIHEIIHGIKVDLKGLIEYCNEEMLERKQSKIGFSIS